MGSRNRFAPTPPLGWNLPPACSPQSRPVLRRTQTNSWDTFGVAIAEAEVRAQAEAMARLLAPSGYRKENAMMISSSIGTECMLLAFTALIALGLGYAQEARSAEQEAKTIRVTFDKIALGPYTKQKAASEWPGLQWVGWGDRAKIVAAEKDNAQRFLELAYPAGKIGSADSGGQFEVSLPARDEYWLDYFVIFRPAFDFRKGGKLPGLCGGHPIASGGAPTGGKAWTARHMWKEEGKLVVYLYDADKTQKYGRGIPLGVKFTPGQWHRITQHIKVNTGSNHDGWIEEWFDLKPVLERKDIRFRDAPDAPVEFFFFSTFHGGNTADWAPQNDSYACFDDFLITASKREALDPARKPPESKPSKGGL